MIPLVQQKAQADRDANKTHLCVSYMALKTMTLGFLIEREIWPLVATHLFKIDM